MKQLKDKSLFRILEYSNHFRIQKQILEPYYILAICVYSKYKWETICKDCNV